MVRDHERRVVLMNSLGDLAARIQAFRQQPFPTDWSKGVNGIGLVSLSTRAERALGEVAALGGWNPEYLRETGQAQAIDADLREILTSLDQALPALPAEPRHYFEQCRSLVAEAAALADAWWAWADGRDDGREQ